MSRFFAVLFFLAFSLVAMGEPVTFTVQADANSMLLGRTVEVRFVLENASGSNFSPPSFKGFKVLNGPSQQFSSTFINGKKSYSEAYSYVLQAVAQGTQRIESAQIRVEGKNMSSNILEIKVVEKQPVAQGALPKDAEQLPVFIQTELSKKEVFEGEQIQVLYRIYTRVGVEGIDVLAEPSYDGFYTRQLQRYDKRKTVEKIGSYEYTTSVLAATALFPMRTGTLTIEPLSLQAGVVQAQQSRDPLRAIFGRNIKPIVLTTDPVQIKVKALPKAPDNFSGAVGSYSFESVLEKTEVPEGAATTLKLKIIGNGDQRRIQLPKVDLPSSFEGYDPKPGLDEEYETLDEIRHEQAWELFVLPSKQGSYTIEPTFCYFDSDSAAFINLKAKASKIEVGPPTPGQANIAKNSPFQAKDSSTATLKRWLQSPVLWAVLLLPLFFFGLLVLFKRQKTTPILAKTAEKKPIEKIVRQVQTPSAPMVTKAYKPSNPLADLHLLKNSDNPSRFYSSLQETLLKNSYAKLNLPTQQISKSHLLSTLRLQQQDAEIVNELETLLENCEKAIYGGWQSADSQDVIIARAASVLKRLS